MGQSRQAAKHRGRLRRLLGWLIFAERDVRKNCALWLCLFGPHSLSTRGPLACPWRVRHQALSEAGLCQPIPGKWALRQAWPWASRRCPWALAPSAKSVCAPPTLPTHARPGREHWAWSPDRRIRGRTSCIFSICETAPRRPGFIRGKWECYWAMPFVAEIPRNSARERPGLG